MAPPPVGTAPATRVAPAAAHPGSARRPRVVIIGAGITGLVLSLGLTRRRIPHVLLERRDRPGGVIRTRVHGDDVLEEGPQRTRLTPGVRALLRELNLEPEVIAAPPGMPLFIWRAGRLRVAPLSLPQFATTDLLSAGERLRLLAEPYTPPMRYQETVAEYLTRRFGRAAYVHFLGPLFGGLYGSECSEMLARHALRSLLDDLNARRSAVLAFLRHRLRSRAESPACSFRNGMQTLTDALARRVHRRLRLDAPAVRLARGGDGFRVYAGDEVLSARTVVLTCPARAAGMLLGDIDAASGQALGSLTYNRIALVHLRSEARLTGMGFQSSLDEPLRTRGVTFNHALFGREGIYTAFLTGARAAMLLDRTDAEVGAAAAEDFRTVTGTDAAVIGVVRTAVPAWDRTWAELEHLRLPRGIVVCSNYESRIGIPGRIRRATELAEML